MDSSVLIVEKMVHSILKLWMLVIRLSPISVAILVLLNLCSFVSAQDVPSWDLIVQSENPRDDFVASPSLAVLPNGNLVASHIWKGPGFRKPTTDIHSSDDGGKTWTRIARLESMLWGELVPIDDKLFLIGVGRRFGSILIRSSSDDGRTWTTPDEDSGKLTNQVGYYTFRSPSLIHKGRIWKCVQRLSKKNFYSFMISAPVDSDLLDPNVWTRSNAVGVASDAFGGTGDRISEGSVVPDGDKLKVLFRVTNPPIGGRGCVGEVSDLDGKLSLSISQITALPGGMNPFMARYDEQSKKYWAVTTPESDPVARCNRLAIISSENLIDWKVDYIPFYHVDSTWHGFGAPCFCIEGDDLLVVSDCAWGGTPNWSRADKLIFKRIENFRNLKISDSPPPFGRKEQEFRYEHPQMSVEGDGFRVADFENGAASFFNFPQFSWEQVPDNFEGWKFTKIPAGRRADFSVTAKRDVRLFIAIAENHRAPTITGWTATQDAFEYVSKNEENGPKMRVFFRDIKQGNVIQIPQSGWAGTTLLIPPE